MDKPDAIFDLLPIDRVAKLLGVDNRRIYKLVKAGGLPSVRMGARYLVERGALMEWVKAGSQIQSRKERS
jgi:excisionase family DNA binding protein